MNFVRHDSKLRLVSGKIELHRMKESIKISGSSNVYEPTREITILIFVPSLNRPELCNTDTIKRP